MCIDPDVEFLSLSADKELSNTTNKRKVNNCDQISDNVKKSKKKKKIVLLKVLIKKKVNKIITVLKNK